MLYFIEKGLLRRFVVREDRRISLQFHLEDEFIITLKGRGGKESRTGFGIEALEDSLLWCIPGKIVEDLRGNHLRFMIQLNEIFVRGLMGINYGEICSNAKGSSDNFKNLCQHFPRWLTRVPIEYLADFTNIPEKVFRRWCENYIKRYPFGESRRASRR
jgi:hypothetical protein